ncbi:MAG: thiamine pyrophosphate-binding protein [Anaerolineae bacterium]|nr:thiamine pyrophosphate-binding protein [Anaerolineae bacterium]
MHGGVLVADVLNRHGVQNLFTLCGGHISPILVAAKQQNIRIVDVRDEATAVFAADAVARLTGIPGVAAVTAGPGLTNTITAVKNAQMAQSPVIIIGGATATLLKGRGALQDIDQIALMTPHVKQTFAVQRVRDIVPTLLDAFRLSQEGIPGPVFVELPVDLLYPEPVVREWTGAAAGKSKSLTGRATNWYIGRHIKKTFDGAWKAQYAMAQPAVPPQPSESDLQKSIDLLKQSKRPVMVIGSQALLAPDHADQLQTAVIALGIPTYLSGMARGLLGRDALHMRHKRSNALKEADVVVLAGVPCDFRLNYGRSIPRKATYIGVNRDSAELKKNRKPDLAIVADPGTYLRQLAAFWSEQPGKWAAWHAQLSQRDVARDVEIVRQAQEAVDLVNPIELCRQIEAVAADDSVFIGDGGDFVATASYIVRPRSPLSWLDPGVFGTLGPGAGFALGAKLVRPDAEVWLIYGDGSAAYSLAEFDTFARHGIPIIAVVGTDASWAQIARDQVTLLGDSVGTDLVRTAYHAVAAGYGSKGLLLDNPENVTACLREAQALAAQGYAVLINAHIGRTDFRKGSLSI